MKRTFHGGFDMEETIIRERVRVMCAELFPEIVLQFASREDIEWVVNFTEKAINKTLLLVNDMLTSK